MRFAELLLGRGNVELVDLFVQGQLDLVRLLTGGGEDSGLRPDAK